MHFAGVLHLPVCMCLFAQTVGVFVRVCVCKVVRNVQCARAVLLVPVRLRNLLCGNESGNDDHDGDNGARALSSC